MSTFKGRGLVDVKPFEYKNDFFFRNNFNDNKYILFKQVRFFTPRGIISLKNNLYSAGVIQNFRRMNRDVS